MRKTMSQRTTRGTTFVSKTRAPWTVALHRRIAAAASIAACVLSLQMRRQPRSDAVGFAEGRCLLDALQDARRREGSP